MKVFKKLIAVTGVCCCLLTVMLAVPKVVVALEPGNYLLDRTVSYINPATGVTDDGGTNVAIGQGMSESLVEESILIEVVGDKTYATIGLGLASNISEVHFYTQLEEGAEYIETDATITSSDTRNEDICNHYTFEIPNTDTYVRIGAYVIPMGREVVFFVKPEETTARVGEEPYTATKIQEDSRNTQVDSHEIEPSEEATAEIAEEPESNIEENMKKTTSNPGIGLGMGAGIVAMLVVIGVVIIRKKKGGQ